MVQEGSGQRAAAFPCSERLAADSVVEGTSTSGSRQVVLPPCAVNACKSRCWPWQLICTSSIVPRRQEDRHARVCIDAAVTLLTVGPVTADGVKIGINIGVPAPPPVVIATPPPPVVVRRHRRRS